MAKVLWEGEWVREDEGDYCLSDEDWSGYELKEE